MIELLFIIIVMPVVAIWVYGMFHALKGSTIKELLLIPFAPIILLGSIIVDLCTGGKEWKERRSRGGDSRDYGWGDYGNDGGC
jgi:hypothetical protein